MKIEFDRAKSEKNARERNLPFGRAADFDWGGALYAGDTRQSYPEPRYVALGHLDDRLHVLCFTPTPGGVRVISLRRANPRETRRYAEETADR